MNKLKILILSFLLVVTSNNFSEYHGPETPQNRPTQAPPNIRDVRLAARRVIAAQRINFMTPRRIILNQGYWHLRNVEFRRQLGLQD